MSAIACCEKKDDEALVFQLIRAPFLCKTRLMPDFFENFKAWFKKAAESTPTQPYLHELIQRREEEKADFDHWKNTLVRRRLSDWLNDQYAIFKVLPNDIDEAMDFLNTPSSKGFVVHFYKTNYSRRDAIHFMDYLKEQVLDLDYRVQISDSRIFNRPDWVETIERHYLKPKPDFMRQGKFNQKYGNVTIEMTLRNDLPHQLKFQATSYKDHLFQDAQDFEVLMQKLL